MSRCIYACDPYSNEPYWDLIIDESDQVGDNMYVCPPLPPPTLLPCGYMGITRLKTEPISVNEFDENNPEDLPYAGYAILQALVYKTVNKNTTYTTCSEHYFCPIPNSYYQQYSNTPDEQIPPLPVKIDDLLIPNRQQPTLYNIHINVIDYVIIKNPSNQDNNWKNMQLIAVGYRQEPATVQQIQESVNPDQCIDRWMAATCHWTSSTAEWVTIHGKECPSVCLPLEIDQPCTDNNQGIITFTPCWT